MAHLLVYYTLLVVIIICIMFVKRSLGTPENSAIQKLSIIIINLASQSTLVRTRLRVQKFICLSSSWTIIGGSCHKIIFVATNLFATNTYVYKSMLVATKYFCRDKHDNTFDVFCRDKSKLVATKLLSR